MMLECKISNFPQILLPLSRNPPILSKIKLLKFYQLLTVLRLPSLVFGHLLILILLDVERVDESNILLKHLGTN